MNDNVIRVLQVVPKMQAAGIESFVMNVYRNIDRTKIQFDFLVHSKEKATFDDEIENLGGKIYRLTYKDDKKFLKYLKDLNDFFQNHREYQIIHGNMQSMMPVYLKIAKKHNVTTRIAHSHNSNYEKSLKGFILHCLSRFSYKFANYHFACSKEAAHYLFGNKKYIFIPNAIDTEKFKFNQSLRTDIRKQLNINKDTIVIGNIARFEYQKNHKRLISIFKDYVKLNPNSLLLLFGEGKLLISIKELVEKNDLSKYVRFMGIRKDVYKFMNAMDLFILTSFYEGLPVVGIEAQSNGLNCIFSDVISRDTNVTHKIKYVSLEKSNTEWINSISENVTNNSERICMYEIMKKSQFNNENNILFLEKLYEEMHKK